MDKVVLITGASSGIGEGIAREIGPAGAKLLLGARRLDRIETIAADINAAGGTAKAVALDVTDRASMADFAQAAMDEWGRIDVLVNNAGVMPLSPLAAGKVDEWDRMIDVNIKGVLWGIGAVLPVMEAQGSGQIINIGSIGALSVVPTAAVYCATKFAVRAISDGLRQESSKVRVTCVNPGVVESELASTITHEETMAAMDAYRAKAWTPPKSPSARLHPPTDQRRIQMKRTTAVVLAATFAIQPAAAQENELKADHPYVGLWVTEDGQIRHELLPNGRYIEARGSRERAYQGRYEVTGAHIDYWDDTGFTADGEFIDGILYHAGMILYRRSVQP